MLWVSRLGGVFPTRSLQRSGALCLLARMCLNQEAVASRGTDLRELLLHDEFLPLGCPEGHNRNIASRAVQPKLGELVTKRLPTGHRKIELVSKIQETLGHFHHSVGEKTDTGWKEPQAQKPAADSPRQGTKPYFGHLGSGIKGCLCCGLEADESIEPASKATPHIGSSGPWGPLRMQCRGQECPIALQRESHCGSATRHNNPSSTGVLAGRCLCTELARQAGVHLGTDSADFPFPQDTCCARTCQWHL